MRRAIVWSLVAITLFLGCSAGSPGPVGGADGGGVLGDPDAAMAGDASTAEGSIADAGVDAATCAPLEKSQPRGVLCLQTADCPPEPPQYIARYCCATVNTTPGVCTLDVSDTRCLRGGCGDGPIECTATTGMLGMRRMCASNPDCKELGLTCCSICKDGVSASLCLSATEATKYGASCM